jgi:phosphoserine phosphatase
MDAVVTVGDGSNDIPLLQAAGLGVAWRGKPSVKAAARARVDHGDLSTLLIFQRLDPA